MYRVELKGLCFFPSPQARKFVPNVPCGVESRALHRPLTGRLAFLMYRVELKDL